MKLSLLAAACATALGLSIASARAEDGVLTVGATLSTTGPAAALGIPEKNALTLVPTEIGGLKVKLIVLDDAGDPTQATTNAKRLINDDKVDVIMGSSITPATIAVAAVAYDAKVPHFGLGPMPIPAGKERYTVVMPQPVPLMAQALFEHMQKHGIKTVGMIGFSDSWGDLWLGQFKSAAEKYGLKLVADERYARADTSVTGQVLKLVAAKPDAVLVAASGTGAALPQVALRERGYKGLIYQTHGAVSQDFIRIAGKAAEGVIMASGPDMLPEGQPDSALTKAPGLALVKAYEAKFGPRNQFAGHPWDAFEVLKRVVPVALKKAKPGTQEFREAIADAFVTEKDIAASQGVYNFTATDRYGVDQRARILLTVKNGKFELVKQD